MTDTNSKDTVDLYSLDTPNGQKIGIALEEIGVKYTPHVINITTGDQFKPEFVAISPNSKIPTIVHHMAQEDGTVIDIPIFESGAILVHLAETFGRTDLLPGLDQPAKRAEVLKWVFWQMGGLGPMAGQMGHFYRYALKDVTDEEEKETKLGYGRQRYLKETQRLYGVIEKQLEGKTYVAGESLTIADMAIFPWLRCIKEYYGMQSHFDSFPNVIKYMEHMESLESVKRGLHATPFPK